jgi:hypothetical protein
VSRLVLVKVGERDGLPLFAPMDAEDEKLCLTNTLVVDTKGERAKRTTLQNKSIHKYCSLLAERFNASGYDMIHVLAKKEASVSWTMASVKEVLWRSIQLAMYPDKPSTTQLETHEVSKVYEQISRHLSEHFNIDQSFPNRHGD